MADQSHILQAVKVRKACIRGGASRCNSVGQLHVLVVGVGCHISEMFEGVLVLLDGFYRSF